MSHEIGNMTAIYDTECVDWVRMVSHELHMWRGCVISIYCSLSWLVTLCCQWSSSTRLADGFCWM